MQERSFLAGLKSLLRRLRLLTWITFGAFVVLSLARVIVGWRPDLWVVVGFALLAILLQLLLEVHDHTCSSISIPYPSFDHAWPDIRTEIEKALARGKSEIHWMGVNTADAVHLVKYLTGLATKGKLRDMSLCLSQYEPDILCRMMPGDPSVLLKGAEAISKELEAFQSRFAADMQESNCGISFKRYRHLPTFYGILINDSVAFVSYFRGDWQGLMAGEEPYRKYTRQKEEDEGFVDLFGSWVRKVET